MKFSPRKISKLVLAVAAVIVATALRPHVACAAEPLPSISAQEYGNQRGPVAPSADGAIYCEAEEFQVVEPGWRARPWGENYYAATLANCFLSRKGFLGAPETGPRTTATTTIQVAEPGQYLTLVRYEAAYRFETQFRVRIEQQGKVVFDRLYGARSNDKIWAFSQKVKKELAWDWGAVENVVWEGHDAVVDLAAGPAVVTLVADPQEGDAARRNVDVLVLTRDRAGVAKRIDTEGYLPLDGLLAQRGDVHVKLTNFADSGPLAVTVSPCTQHSPYWVHQRDWQPVVAPLEPGQTTDWLEVGSLLDTLNDGGWDLAVQPKTAGAAVHWKAEFGIRTPAGSIESIAVFETQKPTLSLAYDADTRYTRRIRRSEQVLYDLLDYLKKQPATGSPPKQTLVYAYSFPPRAGDDQYNAAAAEFHRMFGLTTALPATLESAPRGLIDWRGQTAEQLLATGAKAKADGLAERIAVVSLGDEIGLASPPAGNEAGFHAWLQQQGLEPAKVVPGATAWEAVKFSVDPKLAATQPELYYYSRRYQNHYGIQEQKKLTAAVRANLPHAHVGANFSPHHHHAYLPTIHQWITLFREGGMTLPWGEDYIWQVPVGSQQNNFMCLDAFRAGLRDRPNDPILYYVMPHTPGNTPQAWRRQFYGDLAHGMKIVHLFEFHPVQVAYTENHCSQPEMYLEVRRSLHELAGFEDIVQSGQVQPGTTALWFSETGDIWDDHRAPFDCAKRALYLAIRHGQAALDFVTEEDAVLGNLKKYGALYLTDRHVSRAAAKAIADWVRNGGSLMATAGAGSRDEFDRPNEVMLDVLGLSQVDLVEPAGAPPRLEKQDLPFLEPIDGVRGAAEREIPVFALRTTQKTSAAAGELGVLGKFRDGSQAVVQRKLGAGTVVYCGFLPSLSYLQPALPRRPVDRGSTDDASSHFLPTNFNRDALEILGKLPDRPRQAYVNEPLVEAGVIRSPAGVAVPLVNWTGRPVKGVKVHLAAPVPEKAMLASGGKVERTTSSSGGAVLTLDLDVADAIILR